MRPAEQTFFGYLGPPLEIVSFDYSQVEEEFVDAVRFLGRDVDVVGPPRISGLPLPTGNSIPSQLLLQFEEEEPFDSRPFELPGGAQSGDAPANYDRIVRFPLHRGKGCPGLLATQQMTGNRGRVVDFARDVEGAGEGGPGGTERESAPGREETQEPSAR